MTTQHPTCPLCGANIHEDGRVLVDLDAGLVVVGHHVAQLTRLELSVFSALWRNRPRTFNKEQLMAVSVDPGREDDRELKMADVVICKLRAKLKPLGVSICTVRGEGYRMEHVSRVEGVAA